MAFKRQIVLTAATEEWKQEVTIPNPSNMRIAAFIWLSRGLTGCPDDIRPAMQAFLDAIEKHT